MLGHSGAAGIFLTAGYRGSSLPAILAEARAGASPMSPSACRGCAR